MNTFAERLYELRREKKLARDVLGAKIGVSKTSIKNWEDGENTPKLDRIEELARFFKVDFTWLSTGHGDRELKTNSSSKSDVQFPSKNIAIWSDDDIMPNGVVAIDFMPSVRASLGSGRINDEYSESEKLWFREQTLRDCNVNAEQSVAILVEGDSMLPELADGQAIAIDRSATKIFDGEIYAFRIGDELKVKYLFRYQDGFKAVSRNEDKLRFPDEFYTSQDIETKDIEVLGQFWWKSATRRIRR